MFAGETVEQHVTHLSGMYAYGVGIPRLGLALVQEEVDMRLGKVRTGNDAGHLKVVAVDVLLRDFAVKTGVHHRLLKLEQAFAQVFAFELFFLVPLDQRPDRQQQANGPLLAINDVPGPTFVVKHDSAQEVSRLVLMDGDIGEQLIDVLAGPLVGALVLGISSAGSMSSS